MPEIGPSRLIKDLFNQSRELRGYQRLHVIRRHEKAGVHDLVVIRGSRADRVGRLMGVL